MKNKRKPNWFVRILIVVLFIALSVMIGYKFLYVNPIGDINHYVIIIIFILVVIVLSESFDNFSIGKILNIKRELHRNEEENRTLRAENNILRKNIINLSASLTQNQTSNNIINFPDFYRGKVPVQKANEEDIKEKNEQEEKALRKDKRLIDFVEIKRMEGVALDVFVKKNNLSMASVVKEAKFMKNFSENDPIASFSYIFDAFVKTKDEELFVDIRYVKNSFSSMLMRDRIYALLSKIYVYKLVTKANASLVLVLIFDGSVLEEKEENGMLKLLNRNFYPALVNGILKIEVMSRQELKINESN